MSEIILKPGREKSLLRRHPWIFSGAIAMVNGIPKIGETVEVISSKGDFLAKASYNPQSNISGRVWTWFQSEQVNQDFLENRLVGAIALRQNKDTFITSNAMRLVHAESDGLPGLILDRYDDTYVIQFLTAGIEFWKESIVDIIRRKTDAKILYERSDVDVRQLEGLPFTSGLLFGEKIKNPITIIENKIGFEVDVISGHKTGFYLDQRDNRLLARQLSAGMKVLDCFSYTGGFALNCLHGNARSVTLVDSSKTALNTARKNIYLNKCDNTQLLFIEQDVFTYLRTLRDQSEYFDMIILDPPRFAPTAAQAERASRGYKDINLLAFKLLKKGGYLLTFSCSGGISEDLFQKIVTAAALDAEVDAVILKRLHQALDHPVALNFPE
ncbi:MAG: class I SAM-dependent methyltransferase, partial [Anaerolineales bacterium]